MQTVIYCLSCGRQEWRNHTAKFCFECADQRERERRRAMSAVQAAIQRGKVLKASAHDCVDCGAPATDYEHRDYTLPLNVEPVCAACNARRGPALDSQMRALPPESVQEPDFRQAA